MSSLPSKRLPRSGHARARQLFAAALVAALSGCMATPTPTPRVVHPSPSPSIRDPAEIPALLLWEDRDGTTVLRRTEPTDPTRWRELSVPPGSDYAAAPDSGQVVAIRDGVEVAFGEVGPEGIELAAQAPFPAPEAALEPACLDSDGPAAFLRADANGYLVAFRDGGWASIDAIGTLGDCAWLDADRLLTVGQGPGDPMTLHVMTDDSSLPAGLHGTDPSVSGGAIVARNRSVEPWQLVYWPAAGIDGDRTPPQGAALRPREPGTRYLEGVASPDGRWLAIKADRLGPDGMTSSLLVLADLRDPAGPLLRVPLDFPLADVSWAG